MNKAVSLLKILMPIISAAYGMAIIYLTALPLSGDNPGFGSEMLTWLITLAGIALTLFLVQRGPSRREKPRGNTPLRLQLAATRRYADDENTSHHPAALYTPVTITGFLDLYLCNKQDLCGSSCYCPCCFHFLLFPGIIQPSSNRPGNVLKAGDTRSATRCSPNSEASN